jgi:hypothetical protein
MSQMEGTSKQIGDKTYTMYMLSPMVSHDLLVDVVKMVGPALGPVFDVLFTGTKKELNLDQELDIAFFTKASSALFSGLDKSVFHAVIDAFKLVTHVDDKPLDKIFDIHFAGKLEDMYQWIAFGMSVQWGKSLSALIGEISDRGANKKAESRSPKV